MKVASMPSVLFLIIIYSYSYYNMLIFLLKYTHAILLIPDNMTTTIPAVREAAQASFTPIFIALRQFNKIYLEIANNKVKFAQTKPHKALFSIAKRLPSHATGHSRGSGESGDLSAL